MTDKDTEYRVRSGEKIDVTRARTRDSDRPRALPVGSSPDIAVIPELAAPTRPSATVEFGRSSLVIEDHGNRVVLILPGGVRVEGSRDEALRLAAALRGV